MAPPIQRMLKELLVRLELEPHVFDVFVEGPADRALVSSFLRSRGRLKASVLSIDQVEIPPELLTSEEEASGARGKVLALARLLVGKLGSDIPAVCIIDRDLDDLLGLSSPGPLVLKTDFATIEMYAWDEDILERVVAVYLQKDPSLAKESLQGIEPILVEVSLIRAGNQTLELGCGRMSPDRCCRVEGVGIVFDRTDYLDRYLNRAGMQAARSSLEATVDKLRGRLPGDSKRYIDGHEFVDLLSWYLRQRSANPRVVAPETLRRVLVTQLSSEALGKTTLFRSLLEIVPP